MFCILILHFLFFLHLQSLFYIYQTVETGNFFEKCMLGKIILFLSLVLNLGKQLKNCKIATDRSEVKK